MASIGAFMPAGTYAAYTATKAYLRTPSEAVGPEARAAGVTVTCLCPGPTETEFPDVAGHALQPWERRFFASASSCVSYGLRALFAGRMTAVHGLLWKVTLFLFRFLPRRTVRWLATRVM